MPKGSNHAQNKPTVTREKGKTDKVATGAGSVTVTPEGESEKKAAEISANPEDAQNTNDNSHGPDGGWVNGIAVDGNTQAERDKNFLKMQKEGAAPKPDNRRPVDSSHRQHA